MSEERDHILTLTATNYAVWKTRIWYKINELSAIDAIERDLSESTQKDEKKWNSGALSIIVTNVDDIDLSYLDGCRSAFVAWEKLREKHYSASGIEEFKAWGVIQNIDLIPGKLVEKLQTFHESLAKIESITGKKLEDYVKCGLLLGSLQCHRDKFENIFSIYSALKIEERLYHLMFKEVVEKANSLSATETGQAIGIAAKFNKSKFPFRGRCYNCGKMGHMSSQCWAAKTKTANTVTESDENKTTCDCYAGVVSSFAFKASIGLRRDALLLDSGANVHAENNPDLFIRSRH